MQGSRDMDRVWKLQAILAAKYGSAYQHLAIDWAHMQPGARSEEIVIALSPSFIAVAVRMNQELGQCQFAGSKGGLRNVYCEEIDKRLRQRIASLESPDEYVRVEVDFCRHSIVPFISKFTNATNGFLGRD